MANIILQEGLSLGISSWILPGVVGAVIAAVTVVASLRRGRSPGARELALLGAGVGWWCLWQVIIIQTPTLEGKILGSKIQYLGICIVPLAWVWFAFGYTSRSVSVGRGWWALLALPEAVSLLLAWTDEWHRLVWRTIFLRDAGSFDALQIEYGPWFQIHVYYAYGLVVLGTAVLVAALAQSSYHRKRLFAVVLAAFCPIAANLVYLVGFSGGIPIDLTPTGFAVSGLIFVWSLLRADLLDLPPVARGRILEAIGEGIVVLDNTGKVVDTNAAARSLLGSELNIFRARLKELEANAGEEPTLQVGEKILELTRARTSEVPGGGVVVTVRDVTERHHLERELLHTNRELTKLANTDPLTGLANRRRLYDLLQQEIRRSARYKRSVSLLLIDIDHFKEINDTLGHAAGDTILQELAETIRYVFRDIDMAGRIGGDELAVVLPETDAHGAQIAGARLLERIAGRSFTTVAGLPLTLTISVGAATDDGLLIEVEDLVHSADLALYQAKAAGRNQMRSFTPEVESGLGKSGSD